MKLSPKPISNAISSASSPKTGAPAEPEIDLIAWEGEVLVFVEVKSRSNTAFGEPETFVSPRKQRLLVGAAAHYMEEINYDWEIRFDVIAVTYHGPAGHTIKHLKDAFFPRAF